MVLELGRVAGKAADGICPFVRPAWSDKNDAGSSLADLCGVGWRRAGDDRFSAGQRLKNLIRDHALRLWSGTEYAEQNVGAPDAVREIGVREPALKRHVWQPLRLPFAVIEQWTTAEQHPVYRRGLGKARRFAKQLRAL